MPTTVTKTVKSSGGDYTSLSAWEAGQQGDLVAADEIRQAECYSFADTTVVAVDGWTTDATRYIRVFTPAAERHDGKWNTAKYRLEIASGRPIDLHEDFVRLEGLQILSSGSDDFNTLLVNSDMGVGEIRLSHSIIRNTGTAVKGVTTYAGAATVVKVWNNIFYDWTTGYLATQGAHTVYLYNNTAQNCTTGFSQEVGTVVAKNNIAQDCTDGFAGTFDAASTDNCSDIASDAPGSNPETGEVTFVNEASDDFHLDSTDTVAKDKGADLSADANLAFSDDIDGVARTGSWDIGADEFVAAGGGSTYPQLERGIRGVERGVAV